jgi:hypothetical protein
VSVETTAPGLGRGWARVAQAVAESIPAEQIVRIWVFPPLRREDREWGTAVVTRQTDGARQVVYTGRYMLLLRGRNRGLVRAEVHEVGEGPPDVVHEVIRGVQERSGEADPPVEIEASLWYGGTDDESAAEG